ncbi:SDR family oxidoreductase [Microvirga sp. W0021]|uniref:SDR family oxidoreductase n=1 Tax=Hohaiivirga grylli TaxID=3133970 RepID=A0ABV0BI16_9HYPH
MSGRTWLITGSNRGFGRSLTELILQQGDRVIATTRKPDELDDLVRLYPEHLRVFELDVTDTAGIRQVVDQAFGLFGSIDVLINNAGYLLFGAAEELADEEITDQINTNLIGSIQMVRAVLPYMRQQGGGHIIQHSSMCGQIGLPALSAYQASKWGIEGFLEAVRLEVAPFHIKITIVEPGFAQTGLSHSSRVENKVIKAYQQSTVGNFRRLLAANRFPCPGDGEKIAKAVIAAASQENPPQRLVLGSDAYKNIQKTLNDRLSSLEQQKEIALATDAV